jgi:chemotaxis protein MotA
MLEGGQLSDVAQISAAVIVLGGTAGAVMLTTPSSVLLRAARRAKLLFFSPALDSEQVLEDILAFAAKARKGGVVSLEPDLQNIQDPFLRKAVSLAVDGVQLHALRNLLELDMHMEEADIESDAKVFDAAGGYAPTIGIIGAVIGLIQVMKHLNDLSRVGYGIAVAFVATIYGVGFANLFCLPAGQKIRFLGQQSLRRKELIVEGVAAMVEGMNPRLIRRKLQSFLETPPVAKVAVTSVKGAAPAPEGPEPSAAGSQL